MKDWHEGELQKIKLRSQENLSAIFGKEITVSSLLSKLTEETLRRVCHLAQETIEYKYGKRSDNFTIILTGSMSYGPHLTSDIDFFVVHDGDGKYFNLFVDEMVNIFRETDVDAHNLCEAFDLGTKTIDLKEIPKLIQTFKYSHMFIRALQDIKFIPNIGNESIFFIFEERITPLGSSPKMLSLNNWIKGYARFSNYLTNRKRNEIESLPDNIHLKLKIFYGLARFFYNIKAKNMLELFKMLFEYKIILKEDSIALCYSYEFFMRMRNKLALIGEETLTISNISIISKNMGYDNNDEFINDFYKCYLILENQFEHLKKQIGYTPQMIKWGINLYNISERLRKTWKNVCDYFASGNAKVSIKINL